MTISAHKAMVEAFARIAEEAGRIILDIKRVGPTVERKSDHSPVTEADRAAEHHIITALQNIAPDIPVIAEEQTAKGIVPAISDYFILVDPLDGTSEFIAGRPDYTVNIALIGSGVPLIGAIGIPERGLTYAARPGWAACRDAPSGSWKPISARTVRTPPVAITSFSHRDPETEAWLERWPGCERICIGSSLKFAWIAEGKADVYPRFGPTCEWDTAAGHAILTAAGGSVLTPEGRPLHYGKQKEQFRNGSFIAWGAGALPV